MYMFEGKTALITGASRGIGEATARLFAERGAHVILAARSEEAIEAIACDIRENGGKADAIQVDVSNYDAVARAVAMAEKVSGSLDILINNAGVIDPIARIDESDPEAWGKVVDINVKGVYYGIHAALPAMLAKGSGTIINISSGAATGALEGWSHYCATKAAVLSLTKCTDKEYREKGINVIGMSPGTVATEMQVQIRTSGINPVSQLQPSAHIPASWAAEAIAFLCSPEGAAYAGTDFSLKSNEGRAAVGLPPVTA
ncbi:SDR family oxidoreductase [Rhodobacteraceae bacterium RKSG542]|uniref:SDR family oxidoreductase n=1 Tax=Pseudovibrio flavus TaxID=2529854 RepID=UPI0012BC58A8|nr:SDR family oxidoreductase [Pseudovibrio flavus]MTI18920.1 SDR family oxidoreductase [Pseudovibrio flavus]